MIEKANFLAWPTDQLENMPNCPVCDCSQRRLLYSKLRDLVFHVAPGEWKLYQCLACHSGWLDPRPSPDSVNRAYSNYYTHEARDRPIILRNGQLASVLHDLMNGYMNARYSLNRQPSLAAGRWLLPFLPPLRAAADAECRNTPAPSSCATLLDVGCGNGGFLRIAAEMGWHAEGIEVDPVAAQAARRGGFVIHSGTADALSGLNEHYDVITLNHVIEHVHDPLALLKIIYQLLKPGGSLWLGTPNLDSLGHRRYGRAWRGLEPPRHLVLYNPESINALLRKAGFSTIQRCWQGMAVYPVFSASEAIYREEHNGETPERRPPSIGDILFEYIEMLWATRREFISLVAKK